MITTTETPRLAVRDWRCDCGVVLGLYRDDQIQVKGATGTIYAMVSPVHTTCPRCRRRHVLDLRPDAA